MNTNKVLRASKQNIFDSVLKVKNKTELLELLENEPSLITSKDNKGNNILDYAITNTYITASDIQEMINRGIKLENKNILTKLDVNTQSYSMSYERKTGLTLEKYINRIKDICHVLLENGADPNATDRYGTIVHKLIDRAPQDIYKYVSIYVSIILDNIHHGLDFNIIGMIYVQDIPYGSKKKEKMISIFELLLITNYTIDNIFYGLIESNDKKFIKLYINKTDIIQKLIENIFMSKLKDNDKYYEMVLGFIKILSDNDANIVGDNTDNSPFVKYMNMKNTYNDVIKKLDIEYSKDLKNIKNNRTILIRPALVYNTIINLNGFIMNKILDSGININDYKNGIIDMVRIINIKENDIFNFIKESGIIFKGSTNSTNNRIFDVNNVASNGYNILKSSLSTVNLFNNFIMYLIENGIDINKDDNMFMLLNKYISKKGGMNILLEIIDKNNLLDKYDINSRHNNKTLLFYIIELCLKERDSGGGIIIENMDSILYIIELLLKKGADVNIVCSYVSDIGELMDSSLRYITISLLDVMNDDEITIMFSLKIINLFIDYNIDNVEIGDKTLLFYILYAYSIYYIDTLFSLLDYYMIENKTENDRLQIINLLATSRQDTGYYPLLEEITVKMINRGEKLILNGYDGYAIILMLRDIYINNNNYKDDMVRLTEKIIEKGLDLNYVENYTTILLKDIDDYYNANDIYKPFILEHIKLLLDNGANPNIFIRDKYIFEMTENDELRELLVSYNKSRKDYLLNTELLHKLKQKIWRGFTRFNMQLYNGVLEQDVNPRTLAEPYPQEKLVAFCPICLSLVDHDEGTCMYMTHDCKKSSTTRYYNKELYEKYSYINEKYIDGRLISFIEVSWCTLCGRICRDHRHYELLKYDSNDSPSTITPDAGPYESNCTRNGGGDYKEKLARYIAFRDKVYELDQKVANGEKILESDAMNEISKAAWDGPFTVSDERIRTLLNNISKYKDIEQLYETEKQAALENKLKNITNNNKRANIKKQFTYNIAPPMMNMLTWNIKGDQFPNNQYNVKNISWDTFLFPDVPNTTPEMMPTIHIKLDEDNGIKNYFGVAYDDTDLDHYFIIQFHHKMEDGVINNHENTMISREALKGTIKMYISENNPRLGLCPILTCTAYLHPDELFIALGLNDTKEEYTKKILDIAKEIGISESDATEYANTQYDENMELYLEYKQAFNRKIYMIYKDKMIGGIRKHYKYTYKKQGSKKTTKSIKIKSRKIIKGKRTTKKRKSN